jgi:cytochrome c biogenesis protein CcmG/thiol:disulfide interchange protein DsbE
MLAKRGWILLVAASLLLAGVSLVIVQVRGGRAPLEARPEVGYLAPEFILPSLDGQTVRLSDFRGKKAVFLNFWATWCVPCRQEMPTMEKAYQEYKSRGLEILAVSLDTGSKSAVRNFMSELKLGYPALLDPEMEVLRLYRQFSIPATFLIDKQGIVRHRELGYRDWTTPEARTLLEAILK